MTKKDYIIIANAMNKIYRSFDTLPEPEIYYKQYVITELVGELRDIFQADNEQFNFDKFKAAVYRRS
jgi:hypothetical protein